MTSGKEECAGMLARLAELIQACEEPEAKKMLVQVQARLQDAIVNASDAEAEAIIRMLQKLLDKGSDLGG